MEQKKNKILCNVHQLLSEIFLFFFCYPPLKEHGIVKKRKENDQQHRELAHSTVGYSSLECLRVAWSLEPSPMHVSSISLICSQKKQCL